MVTYQDQLFGMAIIVYGHHSCWWDSAPHGVPLMRLLVRRLHNPGYTNNAIALISSLVWYSK